MQKVVVLGSDTETEHDTETALKCKNTHAMIPASLPFGVLPPPPLNSVNLIIISILMDELSSISTSDIQSSISTQMPSVIVILSCIFYAGIQEIHIVSPLL
jgi:hypothetical protein